MPPFSALWLDNSFIVLYAFLWLTIVLLFYGLKTLLTAFSYNLFTLLLLRYLRTSVQIGSRLTAKTSVNNQIKHFDRITSAFHILLYYSDSPIFAPETFNLTP